MKFPTWVYEPVPGREVYLQRELSLLGPCRVIVPGLYEGRAPVGAPGDPVWYRNAWANPESSNFDSISEAARLLRRHNGLWCERLPLYHRRGLLIKKLLPKFRPKPLVFPERVPSSTVGAWTLLNENTLVWSTYTTSPFAYGEAMFQRVEDLSPSEAYLKLQEALTLARHWTGVFPKKAQNCLDAGASPGGWSWVLARLGCRILAIDRSPLHSALEGCRGLCYLRGDGFKITPARLNREGWDPFDWVLSDMVAYPDKVLDWVRLWLEAPQPPHMVVTIKLQDEPDWETLRKFQAIQEGKLIHLYHNKHELTWVRIEKSRK